MIALLAVAAWRDLATREIPDGICIAVAVVGLALRAGAGPGPMAWSLGLAALMFGALVALHALGGLGGGDVKLAAATVLGLPPVRVYHFVVITVLAGGALVLVHLALRLLPPAAACPAGASSLRRVWVVERWRVRRRGPLPYGVAIACGGAVAILSGIGG